MNKKYFKTKLAAASALAISAAGPANAALPLDSQTAVDGISLFANDMIAAAWPIAATIVVASIGIKLFKKFSNKAT